MRGRFCLAVAAAGVTQLSQAWAIYLLTFVLGGFLSIIYPVWVAHANDRVPILGTLVMGRAGIAGVFLYVAAIGALFAALALWRALVVEGPEQRPRPYLILDERMSHQVAHVAGEGEFANRKV